MGQALIDWFEDEKYSFYEDLNFDEDNEIYPDDSIEPLIDKAIRFADRPTKRMSSAMEDNFRDIIERRVSPEWQKIADTNRDKFETELFTQKELVKELLRSSKSEEEQREYSKQLKSISRYSFAGVRSGEARRAKSALRRMF